MDTTPSVIAVLDDDVRMRTALRRLMTVHGFRVEEFERGAVRTNQGTGTASWDPPYNQGTVAKTQSGNVFAAKDGSVSKKASDGWSQNSGNGWESAAKPEPRSAPERQQSFGFNRSDFESQARSRERGGFQTQRIRSWQSSERFGGGCRGGGDRRR